MSGIYPIPVGRSSGMLIQQRLINQLQSDQLDILRLTSQASTGRRLLAPSYDAPAAVRGIALQRILEQKEQAKVNLTTSRSFLSASETAIAKVADLLNDVRGAAVQAADSTTSQTQRLAIAEEVQAALTQLLDVGNQQFRDRFLFAGSTSTVRPYALQNGKVVYRGNEQELRSYADVDQLLSASIAGASVLGGLSAEVRGSAILTPVLSAETPLSSLNGGAGVTLGSIIVSDGTSRATIDLSGAKTLGDVVRRLEANPPFNRTITARIGNRGLEIALDASGGGTLTIVDSGSGETASALGITAPNNTTTEIYGADLQPQLRLATPLGSLLGTRATARLTFAGAGNDLVLEATSNGAAHNGITVQFVDDDLVQAGPGLTAGAETAVYSSAATTARAGLRFSGAGNDLLIAATTPGVQFNYVRIELQAVSGMGDSATAAYDPASRRLTIQVDSANQTSVAALAAAVDSTGLFTAVEDSSAGEALDPTAKVLGADAGVISGNTGNSGGEAGTIFVFVEKGRSTAAQAAAALQANPSVAERFTVRFDGKDSTSSGDAGSGIVDLSVSSVTAGGAGEAFDADSGLQVVVGETAYTIDFRGANTVEDLLNILNGSPAGLLAKVNAAGNGIDIRTRMSGVNFHIGENGGVTASQLGVRTLTRDTALADLNHGRGVHVAEGADFILRRSDGAELEIDISSAVTIGEVLDAINTHPDNQDPGTAVTARLAAFGNGIELVDANPAAGEPLTIVRSIRSEAALDLGFLSSGQTEASADPVTNILAARDVNPVEADGAFNTLLRLNDAIRAGDLREISRTLSLLETDLERVSFSRGDLGARQRSLDVLESRLQDEEIELRKTLSSEIDVDLVETISNLTARQTSLEASLRQTATTLRTSLLDYL